MGDLTDRIGNKKRRKIKGTKKEPSILAIKKPTDLYCFDVFRMANSFINHKDIHKFTWNKISNNYTTGNKKMAKIIKDVRACRV